MNNRILLLSVILVMEWYLFIDMIVNDINIFHVLIVPMGIFGAWAVYTRWYVLGQDAVEVEREQ